MFYSRAFLGQAGPYGIRPAESINRPHPELVLATMSDEAEVVDPLPQIREACRKNCPHPERLYKECVQRITEKKAGDCEAWYFDMIACVDKCVAPKIFQQTKEGSP